MNQNILTLVHLMAHQSVQKYRANPREFEFVTIVKQLGRASVSKLLAVAKKVNERNVQ